MTLDQLHHRIDQIRKGIPDLQKKLAMMDRELRPLSVKVKHLRQDRAAISKQLQSYKKALRMAREQYNDLAYGQQKGMKLL